MKSTGLIPGFVLICCLLAPVNSGAQFTNFWRVGLPGAHSDATPAIAANGTLYQPEFNGTLLAVTPDGQANWEFKAGHLIAIAPTNAAPTARSPWPVFRGNAMHPARAN